ncbi:hypothetical protein G6F50_016037 [Rhizopus delemar]|uniref:Uncharacterized protein n=1 Tax=Rhizopus delemar TaxID=936053 RepID=A0A9P6XVB3_9FUNG|nr:hypothetical protein G6F50_016037 [Rhizopus delemar]
MARNSCEPAGSNQVSNARRFTPIRVANTSRVRFRRRMASRRKACWEMVMTGPEKEDLYTHRAYYSQRKCKSNTFAYTGLPLNSNGWQRQGAEQIANHRQQLGRPMAARQVPRVALTQQADLRQVGEQQPQARHEQSGQEPGQRQLEGRCGDIAAHNPQ